MEKTLDQEFPIRQYSANEEVTSVMDVDDDIDVIVFVLQRSNFHDLPATQRVCDITSR